MNTVTIYSLIDPRTSQTRYIGWTAKSLDMRLAAHLKDPRSWRTSQWFNELHSLGMRPLIQSVDVVAWESRHVAERQWIRKLADSGAPLLNWIHNKRSWRKV